MTSARAIVFAMIVHSTRLLRQQLPQVTVRIVYRGYPIIIHGNGEVPFG